MIEFKTKLEQTRQKLLDLTKRNKLINYKKPSNSKYIKIIDKPIEFIYKHLVENENSFKFKSIPEPNIENEELIQIEIQAKKLGFNISSELPKIDLTQNNIDKKYTNNYLYTLHYPNELEKILKKLELNSKNIIQETGTNMLYLILGILEWSETDNSEVLLNSPLVTIPIILKRDSLNTNSTTYEYIIEYSGETIETNKSLAEKLKNDFDIKLPEFTEEINFEKYILEIQKICKNRKNWKIKNNAFLDFLQFNKILLYKDLDTNIWGDLLYKNKILNDIFLGKNSTNISYAPIEYNIDENQIANKIPLILDADSSQHSAIIDVLNGKNIVIEGPPGTGKSQTISNMIASLIAEGKNVLFVSEKLAALEVVYKRLEKNNLGDFCLELHSHKSKKIKVLESLSNRLNKSYKSPDEIDIIKTELNTKKKELKKYIDVLHSSYGKTNKTLFEIFWLVEKYYKVSQYLKFNIPNAKNFTLLEIDNIEEQLKKYQRFLENYDFQSFYWNGFEIENLEFKNKENFIIDLKNLYNSYKKLETYFSNIDTENELNETKFIKLFLENNSSYLENEFQINLLNILNKNTNIFSNYLEISEQYNSIFTNIQNQIKNIELLTDKEINFLINLNEEIIIDIDNKYIQTKKEYDNILSHLQSILNFDFENIEHFKKDLSSIEEFLYPNISLNKLNEVYLINTSFLTLLSKFEKTQKELFTLIGIPKTFDIYTINNLFEGLKLIQEIDEELYINLSSDAGSSKYLNLINIAKQQQEKLINLKVKNELYFDLKKLNTKNIEEIEQIKIDLLDKKDSIFKIFSTKFKKAKNNYINLLNTNLSLNSNEWIKQLDEAIDYLKLKNEYENNIEFKINFHNLFNGTNTQWNKIEILSNWAKQVRKNIKNYTYLEFILKGDEQIFISLNSYYKELNEILAQFNQYIKTIQQIYPPHFIKNIFTNIDDIDISTLKNKLLDLNQNIDKYLLKIDTRITNKNIEIDKIISLLNKYYVINQQYNESKIFINKFLNQNLISFIDIQKISLLEIRTLLKEKSLIDNKLNETINYINNYLNYKLNLDEKEKKEIKKHLKLINIIQNSNLSNSLKISLIKNYNETFNLLKSIKKEYDINLNLNKKIQLYGNINFSIFYTQKLTKYKIITEKLSKIDEYTKDLSIWIDYKNLIISIKKFALTEIINGIENNALPVKHIIDCFFYNFYNSILKEVFFEFPLLNQFNKLSHEELINKFKKLDIKLIELNKQFVASKASQRHFPPANSGGTIKNFTNLKLIQHEISKKKRHIPIRQFVKRAGKAIQALKPCFMMSPLSVAQYLPPNELDFDILIIDEASQLRPEEALGLIARTKQIVIVGDPKQLPPTSFFNYSNEDENENETILDNTESILDSCINLYNPIRRLKWHYRSKHESLITYSNKKFYDNDLIVFPSPTSIKNHELGVKYTYISNGIYHSGNSQRYNIIEAESLVKNIIEQMAIYPNKSLCIGTFNTSQRDLIQNLIDKEEKRNSIVRDYISKWENSSEPFFVKNLENLQGDERDVIFISTTYGPDKNTKKVMQRFGPINQDTGWRRLNVLITRAREKMHIFTSMKSDDIIIGENSSKGVIALKGFLKFLETGNSLNEIDITNKGFDSPFEESVYQLLDDIGIKTIPQVGVAGYFIDLAVKSNNSDDFILAIECDGATYHSSKSARDRDRLKDEVLKNLGWEVYRIWSVDWYKNRDNEISKLIKVIQTQQQKYNKIKNISPKKEILKIQKQHNKNNKYKFLSNEEIKKRLISLRDTKLAKEFQINKYSILSSMMMEQFIKYKPINIDEFREFIPSEFKKNIDEHQLHYLDDIFEILEMAE